MNDDKSLRATQKATIYQREKLVDKMQFLIFNQYENTDLTDFTTILKYKDQGQVAHMEILTKDETQEYKGQGYTTYTLPIDTNLTQFAGDVELRITLLKVDLENKIQYVLHTGECVITVLPLEDYYTFVTDESLEYIDKIVVSNENDSYYALSKDGAENMINQLEQGNKIDDMVLKVGGGGIKGSILTTLYLIILTLIIALPLGIGCAIYLNEYASKNKFLTLLHSLIDMLGGIPSIIFGFFGMFIFIPFCDLSFHTNGGSIISGSLTLAVMLLPTIIKNVEESLYVIPNSYRSASLALGASKSQTIFKIILPNSLSGILTATVLSIGRVIGESASLIFALGTAIKDSIKLTGNGTSLAVHIWVLMGGEEPNFDASCAIAIVILIIVLLLNLFVKLIERKLSKYA